MIIDNSKTLFRDSDSLWYCMTCQKNKDSHIIDGDETEAVTRITSSVCANNKDHVTISKETVSQSYKLQPETYWDIKRLSRQRVDKSKSTNPFRLN